MPASLVNHINGNALYNITHPLFTHVLQELKREENTEFQAIPYDYRISQIIQEGMHGTPPEFPFPLMKRADGSEYKLPAKKNKFRRWWKQYGDDEPVKESRLISNLADSNYLLKHLGGQEALVHGTNIYQPLDPNSHVSIILHN